MAVFRIRTDQLSAALRSESKKMQRCVDVAMKLAAGRWKSYLKKSVDDKDITHTGRYRDGFVVRTLGGKVIIENDHPAAAVIELGCAPHPVSLEGQEAIRIWAIEKLGVDPEEARRAAFLISRHIREYGQQPKYVVRDAIPRLLEIFAEELHSLLKRERVQFS